MRLAIWLARNRQSMLETQGRPSQGKATHVLSLTLALSLLSGPVGCTVGPVIRRGIWLALRGARVRPGASPPARVRVRLRERDRFRRHAARFVRAQENRFRWTRARQRVLFSVASLPFSLHRSVARSPLLGGLARARLIRLTDRLTTSKQTEPTNPPVLHTSYFTLNIKDATARAPIQEDCHDGSDSFSV